MGIPALSAVDEPADLALAQGRRREAPLPELRGETLEDGLVAELLRLELAMTADHELLDRFGEVGEQLVDQPAELPRPEGGNPLEVRQQVAERLVAPHGH